MDITMPQLGESVTEGTILRWFKSVGEPIGTNEVLFEVATDKVDAEVPSPVAGVITAIRVPEGATVPVGAVLAIVDGAIAPPATAPEAPPTTPVTADLEPATERNGPTAPHASPLARRILRDAGIDVTSVTGTGRHGRITRDDAERAASRRPPATTPAPTVQLPQVPTSSLPGDTPGPPAPTTESTTPPTDGDTIVPLNRIRRRTASHMVASRATSPHALVAVEVRYDRVERARQAHGEAFRAEEGLSLTYLPFIARATIDALRRFPSVNASVTTMAGGATSSGAGASGATSPPVGDGLTLHHDVNLGIAVDLAFEGLVAPVVHHADDLRLRALARRIGHSARRARAGELGPDDLAGGTFTITNSGSYGTHLVIPIINQPQVAILSTDAVRRRPVVVRTDDGAGASEEAIGIGSVGLLALSWDHRAFDGAYASAFLDEVRTIIETRDWEAELR